MENEKVFKEIGNALELAERIYGLANYSKDQKDSDVHLLSLEREECVQSAKEIESISRYLLVDSKVVRVIEMIINPPNKDFNEIHYQLRKILE